MRRESKAIYGARSVDDKDDGKDTGVVGVDFWNILLTELGLLEQRDGVRYMNRGGRGKGLGVGNKIEEVGNSNPYSSEEPTKGKYDLDSSKLSALVK